MPDRIKLTRHDYYKDAPWYTGEIRESAQDGTIGGFMGNVSVQPVNPAGKTYTVKVKDKLGNVILTRKITSETPDGVPAAAAELLRSEAEEYIKFWERVQSVRLEA